MGGVGRALVFVVVVLAFLGTVPLVAATASAASAPPAALPPTSPLSAPAPTSVAARPPPPLFCPMGYPGYGPLPGNAYPLDPDFDFQGPCHYAAADEIHASFASGTAGSASRWTLPWTLPNQGSAGQQNVEDGLYVGMVVAGDPGSQWNQSYLEVDALPVPGAGANLTWNLSLVVLSFVNMTYFHPAGCPTYAYNLSWNNTYFCEFDDLSGGNPITLLGGVASGTALAVTVDGSTSATTGMNVWVNETSGAQTPTFTQLNLTTTDTFVYEPAYSAACALCYLTWGLSYGLGVGVQVCPYGGAAFAACDTYNGTAYSTLPPVTFGVPEFWSGSGYGGDYRYLLPESASGVCDSSPPAGIVTAACFEYTGNGGDGFYPYFSLTATGLDFGMTYSDSVTDFGGAFQQFLNTPGTQDLTPFLVTHVADTSLAGYLPAGDPLNVTFNVTDLGQIGTTTLAWSANGSAWTTDPLTGVGSGSARAYFDSIPAGPNGPIRYQVNSSNGATATLSGSIHTVLRGPLPTFSVGIGISPPFCGSVTVGGQVYVNGSTARIGPGPVPISASGCYPYAFASWATNGALTTSGGASTTLVVAGDGNLTAQFTYERPTQFLSIHLSPDGCGTVNIDGTAYTNGSVASVLYGLSHDLTASALCAGYAFGGWTPGANVTVLGSSLVVLNNGTLNATFVPTSQTFPVGFATDPFTCGGVGLAGAGYTSGEYLNVFPGQYPLTPEPCAHFGFDNFTTSGAGVSVTGTTLTVVGNGTVLENNFALTEVYVRTTPGSCGGIVLDGTTYTNGTYVPVQNHSTYTATAFTCPGHYLNGFSASGGLTLQGSLLTVNASGTLLAVSLAGTPSIFVGFGTTPAKCGEINLNGVDYANGGYVTLPPDQVMSISPLPCANYGVVGWEVTGDIQIVGSTVYLNGSGAIDAIFGALVPILIDTIPSNCGSALIDGVPYLNGQSATLINGKTYSILPAPCAHYELQDFESSPYVAILNSTIAPDGPSTITAVYVAIPYTVDASVFGPGCGSVTLSGAPVGSNEPFNLTAGNYTLTEVACATSEFAGYTLTANLSVASGHLFVNGSGTLNATFLPVLPSVTLGGNGAAFVGGTALFYAAVAVPVSPTGYTYSWNFGDGATNTTSVNTTTHIFERTGSFTVTVQVTDPFHHSANASLPVTVVAQSSTNYSGSLGTALLVAGIALAAVVAIWLVSRRPPRAPPGSPPPEEPATPGAPLA